MNVSCQDPRTEMPEPVAWADDGTPTSPRFGDTYRSRSGGLAQAQTVFLQGCGLPGRWQGRPVFTVLETGFGLGLNGLATWLAWRRDPRRCGVLRYQAIEAYPVAAHDVLRSAAQAADDGQAADILPLAAELAAAWPRLIGPPGWRMVRLDGGALELHLGVGEVAARVRDVPHAADAVYLDGFSPARNPAMWQAQVLAAVVRCCQPQARLATYTVARSVRDALAAQGLIVERHPGLPPKRHRLEAGWPQPAAPATTGP